MTAQHDLASQALHDPSLIEGMQLLDHRIRFGPTQSGWFSFVALRGSVQPFFLHLTATPFSWRPES